MYKTEQEEFWRGQFGDSYIARNQGQELLASNLAFFSEVLQRTEKISSIIEFGANVGMNLKAIAILQGGVDCAAIEINHKAAEMLRNDSFFGENITVYEESILDFEVKTTWDFVLIKGVCIHINPSELDSVYKKLHDASKKYICIAEYYNPTPVEVNYRGNTGKLFKRDFAGEFLDKYSDFRLVDYGFKYHGDPNFPQDDMTWFLLEKK